MALLTSIQATMVTKSDLSQFEDRVKETVKEEVKREVQQAVTALETRVSTLELAPRSTTHSNASPAGDNTENNKAADRADPARLQAAFLNWPDSLSAAARLTHLETLVQRFPDYRAVKFFNGYKGPHNNRTLSNVCYAEFATTDDAKKFCQSYLDNPTHHLTLGTNTVKVAPALTKLNRFRGWALKKAAELLRTAAPDAQVVEVKNMSDRRVTVNTATAFQQQPYELKGSFTGSYSHLALPQ